jgi:amino acid transporter
VADQQTQETGYERLGEKKLTLVDVIAQSVGFMGPVFSAAFIIPAIVGVNAAAKGAGVAAPLSVLIAAVGVFALGWIVAQYAKRIHAAGSLYDYVSNGLGSTLGAAAGWLYYGGTIILTTGLGVLVGGYVHDILLPTWEIEGGIFPIWVWDSIWAILLFVVLYFGVQISTRVQLALALISVAVVLAFMISVIVQLGGDNDFATTLNPNSSPDGWSGIFFGVLYGVLIFVGFETAANLGEETAEPKRSIPKAVLLSVVVVSVFYLIASYVVVAGYGFNLDAIAAANDAGPALILLGAPDPGFGSELILKVLLLVVLFDILAVGVGAAVASTRGVFAMARDRRLPAPLASVSKRYGTPVGSILLLIVIQVVLIVATETNDTFLQLGPLPHYFSVFIWCATFGAFALLVVYLMMSIGAARGLADHPNKVGLWIAITLGVLITAAGIFGSFYKVTSPTLLAPWAAVAWGILGLIYMMLVRGREPASQVLGDLQEPGGTRG